VLRGTDIVGIREETDTCHHTGANMVPSERRLVDLGQGETSALIHVVDVSEVIVEVVESSVPSRRSSLSHCKQ
jgi:hypothetical protein